MITIEQYIQQPPRAFSYGTNDCLTWTMEFFNEALGILLVECLPQYHSHRSALQYLASIKMKYEQWFEWFMSNHAFEKAEPAPGNVVMFTYPAAKGLTVGLRVNEQAVAMLGDRKVIVATEGVSVKQEWRRIGGVSCQS